MKVKSNSKLLFVFLLVMIVSASCSKSSSSDPTPQNTIITSDSSEYNGRLKAEVRNNSNNLEPNAIVYLYANYSDLERNLSLNYIYTNSSGIADFGYLLQGNYYLMAQSTTNSLLRDTTVVQVNSKRETTRTMRLSY